jgi:hypothetical protein
LGGHINNYYSSDSHETRSFYTNLALKIIVIMPTVSTALLRQGKKWKTTSVLFLTTVGVSDAPGGVVDANSLVLLKVGVGLLTAGGGPSGGVGSFGTGDVAVARRLTLACCLLAAVLAGGVWLVGKLLPSIRDGPDPKGGTI